MSRRRLSVSYRDRVGQVEFDPADPANEQCQNRRSGCQDAENNDLKPNPLPRSDPEDCAGGGGERPRHGKGETAKGAGAEKAIHLLTGAAPGAHRQGAREHAQAHDRAHEAENLRRQASRIIGCRSGVTIVLRKLSTVKKSSSPSRPGRAARKIMMSIAIR